MNKMNNIIPGLQNVTSTKTGNQKNVAKNPALKEKFEAILKEKTDLGQVNKDSISADETETDEESKEVKHSSNFQAAMEQLIASMNLPSDISEELKNFFDSTTLTTEQIDAINGVSTESQAENISLFDEKALNNVQNSEIKTDSKEETKSEQKEIFVLQSENKNQQDKISDELKALLNKVAQTGKITADDVKALVSNENADYEEIKKFVDGIFKKTGNDLENLIRKLNLKSDSKNEEINPQDKMNLLKEVLHTEKSDNFMVNSEKSQEKISEKSAFEKETKPEEKIIVKNEFSTDFIISTEQKLKTLEMPTEKEITFTPAESQMIKNADVTGQVLKSINAKMPKGANVFEMQLNPEFLGKVTVKMQIENGRAILEFATQTHKGELALRENLTQLQTALKEQNIEVDRMTVTYDSTGDTGSQLNQNSGEFVFQQNKNQNQNSHNQGGQRSNIILKETEDKGINIVDEDFIKLQQMSIFNYKI